MLIFLIGFILNYLPYFNLDKVRILGVLQRIAICTLLSAPVVVYCSWRATLAVIAVLLTLYSVLMLAVPVPGIGAGVLEPGQDFGAWIDRMVLGKHTWVQSKTWDPEGVVSTIPAICSQLFGVLAGRWLRTDVARTEQTVWMLLSGLLFVWIGAILDTILMPINKSLWTPSFCVLMTGWALIVFSSFYWLLDVNPYTAVRAAAARWTRPFVIYGMNALFVFALSGFLAKMFGYIKFDQPDGTRVALGRLLYAPVRALPIGPVNTSLLYALLFNLFMFALAWFMWRKKWFVKV
jgi:predicted acyltransferase